MTELPSQQAHPTPLNSFACGAKDSFELIGKAQGWQVMQGMVDVFLLDRSSVAAGFRYHLLRVEAGGLMFGAVDAAGATTSLLAVPGNNSVILPFDLGQAPVPDETMVLALERWITALANAMAPGMPPINATVVTSSQISRAEKDEILVAHEHPLWLTRIPAAAEFLDFGPQTAAGTQARLPLTAKTWLALPAGQSVTLQSFADWCKDASLASDLAAFHDLVLAVVGNRYRQKSKAELANLALREERRNQSLAGTIEGLVKTIEDRKVVETHSIHPLFAACELVADCLDIKLSLPIGGGDAIDASSRPVELIARTSRVQCREISLGDNWWKKEGGPLLGYWLDGRPCALLPLASGGYRVVDPTQRIDTKLTPAKAAQIVLTAWQLIEPLPDGPVGLRDLGRFCIKGTGIDALVILIMVILAGTLSLVPPLATKAVFDTVIPSNEGSEAVIIGIGLLLSASSVALFNLVQSIALLRIEGRLDLRLQSALWDRLVRAPAGFFRDHSSGDLVSRMQSVDSIRKLLTGSVISTLVSSVMGMFSLGLMIYYAPMLSLVLALITIAFTLCGLLLGWRLVTLDRQALMLNGDIQSLVVQLLETLGKLRVAAVEDIAFRRWSSLFRTTQDIANKSGHAYVFMLALMGILGPFTLAVLFAFLGFQTGELMAYFLIPTEWDQITGQPMDIIMPMSSFVAFLNAYVQFMTAVTGIMVVGIRLSSLSPLMGRLKPIFKTPTEQFGAQDNPGQIVGRVEFKNVSFRYDKDGPAILNNLSFSIEPGEFVALVGPSGSGKSSAIRLLLGFETQESGSIYLDGRDFGRLDKTLVREQLGVVVQEGKLIPGTIFDNLTGGADVSPEDVWDAARQVGFDIDLQNMPQGLDTPINDGASNISGGQRQRLLVARALIRKPHMLVLDEATSALDNETQEIVSRTIQNMNITRIAVAHRLSTIIKADRIFVIVAGSVVESGTYDELLKLDRVFADLVRQQIE